MTADPAVLIWTEAFAHRNENGEPDVSTTMHNLAPRAGRNLILVTLVMAFVVLVTALALGLPERASSVTVDPRDAQIARLKDRIHELTIPAKPCKRDDGPAPCYWDAGVRGNGHGLSYWLKGRAVHYLDGTVLTYDELGWRR